VTGSAAAFTVILMSTPAQPDNASGANLDRSSAPSDVSPPNGGGTLGEHELETALQLLAERAQFITGATGAALALLHGGEMVCRASAGASAPAVGVRLQVLSGLTGESISRKQLLRCDNAETDSRVNRETCRALGIASIVVLPLLSRDGEVRGLFELFSDHAYAFEERDLRALERMAELTRTALDLAETHHLPIQIPASADVPPISPATQHEPLYENAPAAPVAELASDAETPPEIPTSLASDQTMTMLGAQSVEPGIAISPSVMPEAMQRVQRCASCGFPVSEGRSLCVDCERKGRLSETLDSTSDEPVPEFLASVVPKEESWLANHVNLLAIAVLILSILVAIVVFRS